MRITTQMLNETARKTGVPINNTSLLNHINGGSDGDLLKVLNKGKTSAADTKQKINYEKLEKEADGLKKRADGRAAVDSDKLKAADVDALEKALGSSNDFTAKVSFLAGRISDNAQAGAESLSSQYGRSGDLLSSAGGKYSFWG